MSPIAVGVFVRFGSSSGSAFTCFVVRLVLDEMSRKPMKFEYMMNVLETILVAAAVVLSFGDVLGISFWRRFFLMFCEMA